MYEYNSNLTNIYTITTPKLHKLLLNKEQQYLKSWFSMSVSMVTKLRLGKAASNVVTPNKASYYLTKP